MKHRIYSYTLYIASEKTKFQIVNSDTPDQIFSNIEIKIPKMNTMAIQKKAVLKFLESIVPFDQSIDHRIEFNVALQKIITNIKNSRKYNLNYFITAPFYLKIKSNDCVLVLDDSGIIKTTLG